MMDEFIRGSEDIYREYQLNDDGVALDASTFTEIVITFYNNIDVQLAQYTKTGSTVTVVSADQGTVSCIIPKETTAGKKLGKYRVEIQTTEVDVSYPGGTRDRAGKGWTFKLVK